MIKKSITIILPSFAGGGAEKVVLNFVNGLDKNFLLPTLVVQNGIGPLRIVPKNIKTVDLKSRRLRYAFPLLLKEINHLNPDIVFSTFSHITIFLIIFRRFLPKNLLIIGREANMPALSLLNSPHSAIMRFLYKKIMPKIDILLATSKSMKKELVKFGVDEKKIYIVYNPLNTEGIRDPSQIKRKPGKGLRLLFVGRLVYQKGLDRLIPILRNFSSAHLTIIGEGKERDKLERIVAKYNLKNQISFLGYIKSPFSFMAGADYLVLPSRWEGLPNVALESLSLGTPVITMTEVTGLYDIESHVYEESLIFCKDTKSLVELLYSLSFRPDYKNPSLRPSLLKRFNNPKDFSAKITKIIRELLIEREN